MRPIRALRDCKQRSLTASKKAPTVSKKASPFSSTPQDPHFSGIFTCLEFASFQHPQSHLKPCISLRWWYAIQRPFVSRYLYWTIKSFAIPIIFMLCQTWKAITSYKWWYLSWHRMEIRWKMPKQLNRGEIAWNDMITMPMGSPKGLFPQMRHCLQPISSFILTWRMMVSQWGLQYLQSLLPLPDIADLKLEIGC